MAPCLSRAQTTLHVFFWWPTMMFSPNCRQCVFPADAEGMNQGTDARLPDGSGTNSR